MPYHPLVKWVFFKPPYNQELVLNTALKSRIQDFDKGIQQMVSTIVLMNVERGQSSNVGEKLAAMNGVTEVYSVAGAYDLVALVRTENNEQLADLVSTEIGKIDEIVTTQTMIAFKTFSKFDLDSMFSIGMD
jgi:DNA-binding Lrp family transcriptional regulator